MANLESLADELEILIEKRNTKVWETQQAADFEQYMNSKKLFFFLYFFYFSKI